MSLFNYFARDPWFEFLSIPTIFDQDFGRGMRLSELVKPMFDRLRSVYFSPWRHINSSHSGNSEIQIDKDNFKVVIDVVQFAPDEITVKVTKDMLVAEGKHEEKKVEHGYVSRHFIRRYTVPSGVEIDAVTSTLSSDGVLTISAPRNQALEDGKVRVIPITVTASPAVKNMEKDKVHEVPITKSEREKVHEVKITRSEKENVHEIPITRSEKEKVREIPITRCENENVREIPITRCENENVREIPITRFENENFYEVPISRCESPAVKITDVSSEKGDDY